MTINEMRMKNKALFVADMITFDIMAITTRREFMISVSFEEFSKNTRETLFKSVDEFGMQFVVDLMSVLNVVGFKAEPKFEKGDFIALVVDGFEFKR